MYWDARGQGLFFPPPEPGSEGETNAWRQFRRYDNENPQIWDAFVRTTLDAIKKGYQRIGAHFIIQILRWEIGVQATNDFRKIGNNYFPYYARKFMKEYPQHEGIFELRKLTRK